MKSIALSVVALCTLVACNQQQPGTPAPVVLPNPVTSAADLRCSLPVVTESKVGFVDFPSGRFRADPSAPGDHTWLIYARGAHRWTRVYYALGSQWLSPDGKQVLDANAGAIYSPGGSGGQGQTDVYAIDVVTHAKHRLGQVPGRAHPITWRADGVYLDNGLVVHLDPQTGKSSAIDAHGYDLAQAKAGLWAWVTSTDAWYSLAVGPNQVDQNTILSMSLTDGSLSAWYTARPGRSASILGFVAPREPLIVDYNREPYDRLTGAAYMLLTAPGVTDTIDADPALSPWGLTDTMGVWMSSPGHVWLYNGSGLHAMADVKSAVGSEIPGVGAGPCA